jgi:hypothetical protein
MGILWWRCMLVLLRMRVPLRVAVAKVSRPENTRSVEGGFGREVWGREKERR